MPHDTDLQDKLGLEPHLADIRMDDVEMVDEDWQIIPREYPSDGVLYRDALPFQPRSIHIENFSTSTFTITFDNQSSFPIAAGFLGTILCPPTRYVRVQAQVAGTGSLLLFFYRARIEPVLTGGMASYPTLASVGPPSFATSQVGVPVGGIQIVPARASRVGCRITNLDVANSVFIGAAGVAVNTGDKLGPGASTVISAQAAVFGISSAGTPVVSVWDEYN